MKMKAKTDSEKVIIKEVNGQNPVSYNEFFDIIDIIAGIEIMKEHCQSEYGKEKLAETISELKKRLLIVKANTLFRFVDDEFIEKRIQIEKNRILQNEMEHNKQQINGGMLND